MHTRVQSSRKRRLTSACPLLKSCVPYACAFGTRNDVRIFLNRFLAMPADMCAKGRAPSGSSARNLCHKVWTAQLFAPPWQEHLRLKMPLPFGRFFRRRMRRHTVSPSSQTMVCSLSAPGLSGRILHNGSACKHRTTTRKGNCNTQPMQRRPASDGSLSRNTYETSHSIAKVCSSRPRCTANTMFVTMVLQHTYDRHRPQGW